ncbi:hypothetical protein VNI00_016406 [Paramarasmius palmivorus]|uniref:HMG box domain-containing protein n=1 Tax=Paramarasmius palmivorus TaxID=297713 RepID=A0AAW0BF78_9AGAR
MRYKFDAEQWTPERCSEVFPAQPSIDRRLDKRQARGVFSHEQECWIRTQEENIWSPLHESKFDKAQELGVDVATVEKIYKESMAFQFSIKFEDSLPASWRDKLNRKWVHNKHQTSIRVTQDPNCAPTAVMLATGDPQIYPYGLFFQSVNEQVRNELQAQKQVDGEDEVKIDIGEVQREVGERWRTMTDEDKQVWKNKADDEKQKVNLVGLRSQTIYQNQKNAMGDIGAYLNRLCGHGAGQIGEATFFLIGSWYNKEGSIETRLFDPLDFKKHMSDALSEALKVEWSSWVTENLKRRYFNTDYDDVHSESLQFIPANTTTLYQEKFKQDEHGQYILHPFEPSWSLEECRQHVQLFMEASWESSSQRAKAATLPWAKISDYFVPDITSALARSHIEPQELVEFARANMVHVVGLHQVLIDFQKSHPGQSIWVGTDPKPPVPKRDAEDDQGEGIRIEDLAMLPKRPTHLQSPSRSRVLLSPSSSNAHVSPTRPLSSFPSSPIPSCQQALFPTSIRPTQSADDIGDTESPCPEPNKPTSDIRGSGESPSLSALVPKPPPPLNPALLPDENVLQTTDSSVHSPPEGLSEMVPEFPSPVEANRTSIANDAIEDPSHDFDDPRASPVTNGGVTAGADAVTPFEFPDQEIEQPSTSPRKQGRGKKLGGKQRHAMKTPSAVGMKRAAPHQESQPEHKKRKVIPDVGVTGSGSRRSGRARKPQDRSADNNITGEAQNKRKR